MRRSWVGLVAVAVIALSGCVGIPTSGGVRVGDVINDQPDPDFIIRPDGPRAGSTPEELLSDFMLALRGPQGDYAIARQFLATGVDETWDPDASTVIRTGIPSIAPGSDPNTLSYTVTARAQVNAAGEYSELPPTTQTFDFGFVQEEGEWRISSLLPGIVLSQQSFVDVFTERPLYFFDPSHQYLIPDVRWFPSRQTVPVRVVTALLEGPASWLQGGVVLSAFPISTVLDKATASGAVAIDSGTATVQLSDEALSTSNEDRVYMRQQLAATLGTANVIMTVGGRELTSTQTGTDAVINPRVETRVLVGTGSAFGYDNGEGITPIAGLSDKLVSAGAQAATLASDRQTAAFTTPDGAFVAEAATTDPPLLVDGRSGLIAPSIDPFRFIWSAQGASAASLSTFEVDGTPHAVQTGLPADATIVSLDVSRDGTRLLVYLATTVGPKLMVAGIIRDPSFAPTKLGEFVELPVSDATPIDATWVNDRTVSSIARASEVSPVTTFELGGASGTTGQLGDALAIAGGSGGTDGLRVLRANGEVWRPQGSSWVSTGISASFIATKQ